MGRSHKKSKLAVRVRTTHVMLLGAILLLIVAIAYGMVSNITNAASENFARLYTSELTGKFNLLVYQELALARRASRSPAIVCWLADETDPEKTAAAYDEMKDFNRMLKNTSLYIGSHRSKNEYAIDSSTSLADFRPAEKLDPQEPQYAWYYDCVDSEQEYTLQLHIGYITGIERFWINYKIFDNQELAGVFSAGIPLREAIHGLFSQYDIENVKGYLIDKNGTIKMASAQKGRSPDQADQTEKNITGLYHNSEFNAAMETYLDNINGYVDASSQPVIIKLEADTYSHISIAPIAGTDWSVVTFFSNNSLYSIRKIVFPLAAILAAFLLYTLLVSILMHRLVFSPLNHLTKSITEEKYHNGKIFGYHRDDEIGELAQTIQKIWKRLSINNAEMERLIRIDQLTDIPNRRSFDERLTLEWKRAVREKVSISILILDLDHFKDYNDTYGHLQGDKALQIVAKIFMREIKRSGDFVSRWGGEEFIALLTNTEQEGAFDVAERIRLTIENTRIPLSDDSESKITVSIGVNTAIPAPEDSCEEFIRRADMALYTAKKNGRNRVCREGE